MMTATITRLQHMQVSVSSSPLAPQLPELEYVRPRGLAGKLPSVKLPPIKRRRSSPKKRVRFSKDKGSVHTTTLSKEDTQSCWLQASDFDDIQTDNAKTLFAVKKAQGNVTLLDPEQVCVRGLEAAVCKIVYGVSMRRQREVSKAVVQLYNAQLNKDGKVDEHELRTMSMLLTQKDRARALRNASIDACR